MPVISRFFGVVVYMNHADHSPPHFHARYSEWEAMFGIDPVALLRGELPPRVIGMVIEWATQHGLELAADWDRARQGRSLVPIEPLR